MIITQVIIIEGHALVTATTCPTLASGRAGAAQATARASRKDPNKATRSAGAIADCDTSRARPRTTDVIVSITMRAPPTECVTSAVIGPTSATTTATRTSDRAATVINQIRTETFTLPRRKAITSKYIFSISFAV